MEIPWDSSDDDDYTDNSNEWLPEINKDREAEDDEENVFTQNYQENDAQDKERELMRDLRIICTYSAAIKLTNIS